MISGIIGVRYAKECHPDDLWTSYFTSSFIVNEYRWLYGEPDIVEIRLILSSKEEVLFIEEEVLREINAVKDSRWLNSQNAGKTFTFYDVKRMSKIQKEIQNRIEIKKAKQQRMKINNPSKNEDIKRKISEELIQMWSSPERSKNIRLSLFGRKYPNRSEEHCCKIGKANRGKTMSEETKRKISEANKGKIRTSEQNIKNSERQKGKNISMKIRKKMSEGQKRRYQVENNFVSSHHGS